MADPSSARQPVLHLDIAPHYREEVDPGIIQKAVTVGAEALELEGTPALTVVLTGDERIRELNHQFRDVEAVTDVLAFPADFFDPDLEAVYLGDVVISVPRAAEQAAARGHSLPEELQLLVVHGLLHLAGFDHLDAEDKAVMWDIQARILTALGLNIEVGG